MHTSDTATARPNAIACEQRTAASNYRKTMFAGAIGNGLEFYDFAVYGLFATYIGKTFFPAQTAFMSLLLAIATFGVGFLARPVGALMIGAYADRAGRKAALRLTILLMGLGTFMIGALPGYATLGIWAPILLVVARLIQKLDAPVILKDGTLMVPMRDEDQVAVLSGPALEKRLLWSFKGCSKPSALAIDEDRERLFVACRGAAPKLIIADLRTGKPIATLPISRAVNTMAYDRTLDRLLIPSGADANPTIVARSTDGSYSIKGSVSTRLWSHNLVFDSERAQAYLLTADFTLPAPTDKQPKPDPLFHAGTFTVLTMKNE